ncbi:MAG: dinitrogenase iron-molybdenum cofactor biosynthesis protein [Deltaproteobacteria bacterium]|jgi:predicted Fe-Mo cluster-binding NifX family protein|nr:dinitrogenase iron-molybdenum cofactor biosynthesis protein [Deltaproteobacteria bacterium]MBT4265321.1 dinitrogenase iron-molybdenum cofactor biosynthesis protein [Deltaproteobacteria bacterium]MBT4643981.1 dinitrogenase iron-molybdenum cofactor biosynthesis protein [Deltaproteobacteria bacterium]MBT6613095.1 dinitrogenase iron-molybdenum cofactor biosynthesis protein [Deltaproteobacteria bacterium]MBT7889869.1 dinitrogenase iron-molybdenum cofactor biosynthesis protein [Deltaproteobacteria
MRQKILIPLFGNEVSPRFDLAKEVLIISLDKKNEEREEKTLVLSQTSAEQLCHLILTEGVQVVICGGIEEEHFHYLTWKKVQVFDSIMGDWKKAFDSFNKGNLQTEKNLG